MPPKPLVWFTPGVQGARGTRAAYADEMPPHGISGVYAIGNDRGEYLYVGESHTGRLRKTLIRHFQTWNDPELDRPVYDRYRVLVMWLETADNEALDKEAAWIDAMQPRDNFLFPADHPRFLRR